MSVHTYTHIHTSNTCVVCTFLSCNRKLFVCSLSVSFSVFVCFEATIVQIETTDMPPATTTKLDVRQPVSQPVF